MSFVCFLVVELVHEFEFGILAGQDIRWGRNRAPSIGLPFTSTDARRSMPNTREQ